MSGHSHWATIKRKKGAGDARRGQVFTRLTREIVMSAREGGGDPDSNFSLRIAIEKAREQNMPKENIERGIKRGMGEGKDGIVMEEIMYEGYGPQGVALLVQCVTENRNRTVAEVRHALVRCGGNMGETGSVSWQFKRIAYFALPDAAKDFDKIFEMAVDGGADDVTEDEGTVEIFAPAESFKKIMDMLRKANLKIEDASLRMVPNQEIELSVDHTLQVMRAIEAIEELDDVQNVYTNLKITDEAMAALEAA